MFTRLFKRQTVTASSACIEAVPTDAERSVILGFAEGNESLRTEAVNAFRAARDRGVGNGADAAMRFMFEVDHTNPDPTLRALARTQLLGHED